MGGTGAASSIWCAFGRSAAGAGRNDDDDDDDEDDDEDEGGPAVNGFGTVAAASGSTVCTVAPEAPCAEKVAKRAAGRLDDETMRGAGTF